MVLPRSVTQLRIISRRDVVFASGRAWSGRPVSFSLLPKCVRGGGAPRASHLPGISDERCDAISLSGFYGAVGFKKDVFYLFLFSKLYALAILTRALSLAEPIEL